MINIYLWGDAQRYQNYRRAIEAAGGHIQFNGDPADCDGLLLPGGGDLEPWRYGQKNTASRGLEPERDAAELRLTEEFAVRRKPILGICRGLQTINVSFGGTLLQDLSGHSAIDGMDRWHRVHTVPSVLSYLQEMRGIVNSAHHQAIDRVGSGLEILQWAPDGVVEALCHRRLPILAVQWHPERLLKGMGGEELFCLFLELCKCRKIL